MPRPDYTALTVDMLFEELDVSEKEIQLIRLYAQHEQDPDEWERFFATVDLDTERFVFNCMLARLGARFGWRCVPQHLVPRLKGLRRNLLTRNLALQARALKLMSVIQEQGIPMLVVKGGALRMGLLPDVPQKIADFDVVIPRDRLDECWRALAERGYDIQGYWGHSIDIADQGEGCVDLHWRVFKENVHDEEPTDLIARRGTEVTSHGVTFSIPSPEDEFLKIMANGAGNLVLRQNDKGPISWLADCIDLAERYDLSYEAIAAHAWEYDAIAEHKMAVAVAQRILPDTFPELYASASAAISARTYRRLKAGFRCFRVPDAEYHAYSAPRHLLHAFALIYHENACSYHLDDPLPEVLASYVGLLSERLKSYDHIDHFWEIPALIVRRAGVWKERRERMAEDV